ncbi:MAG: nucleoside hydrolase [Bacteroidota bacterium]
MDSFRLFQLAYLCLFPNLLIAQTPKQQEIALKEEIPLIIFDTDMGSDCDDVGALAILHKYQALGKAKILGCIYSSGKVPFGVGIIDAINTYFDEPNIPIGADHDKSFGDPVDKMDAGKLARDTIAFHHDLIFNTDVPPQTLLTRSILAMQEDNSVTYLTIGHTKALCELLQSEADSISGLTGLELIQKKVKRWVALGGLKANQSQEFGSKDWNFFRNETQPYTDYLVKNFPRPIYFINAGSDVLTGQSLVHAPSGTIVRTAYRDWLWKNEQKTLWEGRPSWDLAAVCFAVEGPNLFFALPESGILHFDIEKGSIWEKKEGENHFYVNQRQGVSTAFGTYLNSLLR